MATLEDAEAARRTHRDRLAAMGADAIEIQPLRDFSGYELIVHFSRVPSAAIPSSLVTTRTRFRRPIQLGVPEGPAG